VSQHGWTSLLALVSVGVVEALLFARIAAMPNVVQETTTFVACWLIAAAAHGGAVLLVLRRPLPTRAALVVVFFGAATFRAVLLPAFPTSSDDLFRYIWDGRVQWQGISPYRYPPAAPELEALRDTEVWPQINRKSSPTIYPPAAQLAFLSIWRVVPDSIVWTKAAFGLVELAAGALLAAALARTGRTPALALVYLWHPLPVFEFAHAGHLDPLMILPIVAALFVRLRERPALVGTFLALAALVKFFPALLLGAWWRWRERRLLAAFAATVVLLYLPYLGVGPAVLGFLPSYFGEEEYATGGRYFLYGPLAGMLPPWVFSLLIVAALGGLSLVFLRRPLPAGSPGWADRACLLATVALLLATPSFPWYYAWLLPLAAFRPRPAQLYLCGAVILVYPWWWLPALEGVPGPQVWVFVPTMVLLAVDLWRSRGALRRLAPIAVRFSEEPR
jgi:hypothetical protein